ncbi:peptide chain release factor N(5)-glutamine methyltransferase [Aquirufa rosea]|uniref:peptide chain release factor N(5)-glutamine methyltransferase n=1 Tax=Aquirufa rosea TaxID=2509241 RepID=A0A4Q1C0W9_9BACT|nr:peptide chain release factor N(5)-glutamine methyltransferase [Aquirufa rosea]RXK50783.1 peptide chain release factor N(5)-glutamine methyltransferase [Aquirufa rosea]
MPVLAADLVRQVQVRIQGLYSPQEAESIAYFFVEMSTGASRMDCLLGKEVEPVEDWESSLGRLAENEPVQYVLGKSWFRDRIFYLNRHTLIPRPETEELVDLALDKLTTLNPPYRVLDVGTGSGCIAISLAKEAAQANVSAWEISPDAKAQAEENANRLGAQVQFELQDVFQWSHRNSSEPWDMIVSNPPYVKLSEAASMENHVKSFEPGLALFVPDANPLIFYHVLERMATKHLNIGGWLIVEINQLFGAETAALFDNERWKNVELKQDFHGKDRFLMAQKAF